MGAHIKKYMLNKEQKEKVSKDYKLHDKDTGSADVQIALLSEEIKSLLGHLKTHPKDQHSRRGLVKAVIKRKKLLKYLETEDKKRFNSIKKKIGLK